MRKDDFLVSRGNGSLHLVGRGALVDREPDPVAFPDTVIRIRADFDMISSKFLALQWNSRPVRSQIEAAARTTAGIYKINQSILNQVVVLLPPLEEQRRIVDILEDHLSRLDAADGNVGSAGSKLEALDLSLLASIRRSLLEQSVPLVPLGEFCDTALGKMLDAKKAVGEPRPYLRNINVRWGHFDLDDVKTVPLTKVEQDRLRLQPGDLLVCEGGEPGRCAVWPEGQAEMVYQKALHRLRIIDSAMALPYYVACMLEEFIRIGRSERLFTGTTIKHLPQEKLRLIELPLPDVQTQRSVLDRLEVRQLAHQRLADELRAIHRKQTALRRALLDAAFSGRLTGRSSDRDVVGEIASV